MNTFFRGLAVGILIGLTAPAQTPDQPPPQPPAQTAALAWTISSSPARFTIEPDQPDKAAPLSWVSLCLPDPTWANMPLRVFTANGTAVGSQLLWSAPGEPATLLFDSSSNAKRYYIYAASNWPALPIENTKVGVTLESRAGDGKEIDHLPDMLQAWSQSTTVNGRAIVQGLFEGGHRFGPQGNTLEHFQGWFEITNPEHLQLAAISNDASFVLVDGKEVVEWPGHHDFRPGLGGQFQGAVDLTPGVHLLDYYNAYLAGDEGHPILCCLAAKGGDLAQWTMLTPDNKFFSPTAHAHVVDYQVQSYAPGTTGAGAAPLFAIEWENSGQSVIGSEIPNLGLIALKLTCRPDTTGALTWTFDDGSTAQGQSVQHLFPRPGMRVVKLSVKDGDRDLGSVSQTINVRPNWTQLTTYQPQLAPEHLADIMARDPTVLSASDLASCVAVFGVFKNSDGLLKILPAVCARLKDFDEADLPYVREACAYLVHEDLAHFNEEGQLLHALVDRCTQDKPSPQVLTVGSQARLLLAQLTLKTSDKTDDAKTLLDAVNVTAINGDEHRNLDILHADLALATGDVAGAKKQYDTLTGDLSGLDARSSVRRTAMIGQARAFIDKKDFEAAEQALIEVAWRAPVEKLSPEWALTRLRLYQEEGLPVAAYIWAKRLLPVITDSGRSELLFRLTDLAFAQNDSDLAKKSLAELIKKYPYSSEAAQAKEKWPGTP